MNTHEAEIVESSSYEETSEEVIKTQEDLLEEDGSRKIVTTKCPNVGCSSTSAYLNGTKRGGNMLNGPGAMNMVQYVCVKCEYAWNLGY